MAVATCTMAGLATAGNCFTQPTISAQQQKAFLVYILANNLAGFGGTNYISDPTTLLNSTTCIKNLSDNQRMGALIGILNGGMPQDYALLSTGIDTLTSAQLLEGSKCFVNWPSDTLDAAILFLICSTWSAQQSIA